MSDHSLPDGKQIINALSNLGKALGYVVETELSIEKDKPSPQAIDIGWLSTKGQDFPLMIFEIESRVTNAVANNPLKVFGKPNQKFEKPLFFFHVMVSGGFETSRIDDLRDEFGRHNYRIYKLANNEGDQLVKDILSQHRRLTHRLDLLLLVNTIKENWPTVNVESILPHIEELGFESESDKFLPVYAELSLGDVNFEQHFVRYLRRQDSQKSKKAESDPFPRWDMVHYPARFFGDYGFPIHLGILAAASRDDFNRRQYFERLCEWQDHYLGNAPTIGPYEAPKIYDDESSRWFSDAFTLECAPSLLGLIALLMSDIEEAAEYLGRQCRNLLTALESYPEVHFFASAFWTLQISVGSDAAADHYEYARKFVNERGGIGQYGLRRLLGLVDSEIDFSCHYPITTSIIDVPTIDVFREMIKISRDLVPISSSKIALAIESLMHDYPGPLWEPQVIRLLHDDIR